MELVLLNIICQINTTFHSGTITWKSKNTMLPTVMAHETEKVIQQQHKYGRLKKKQEMFLHLKKQCREYLVSLWVFSQSLHWKNCIMTQVKPPTAIQKD